MRNANQRVMLEYVKTILEKVSFDSSLFEKELLKARDRMMLDERFELKLWCYANYGKQFPDVLYRIFGR